ncbi:MAG TPA: hypothetical protein VJ302_17630 [Blastocatellia bacterium]|nr:hypothetical protein [Blastocatellia bacterium]
MKMIFSLAVILFLMTGGGLPANSQSPSAQDQPAPEPKQPVRPSTDNSLKIARIVKGTTWYLDGGSKVKAKTLRRLSEDPTANREYLLPIFADPFSPIPRWRIQGDYLYVFSLMPGAERMGHLLVKVRVQDLKASPTEEEAKRLGGIVLWPRAEIMKVGPLNQAFAMQNEDVAHKTRWDEPVWYDFLIDEAEKLTLFINTEGSLAIWELESRNNWESLAADEEKERPRTVAPNQWRKVAQVSAPFSARFAADLQNGKPALMTETGEVWQAEGQYTFRKTGDGTSLPAEAKQAEPEPFLIEDADAGQVWFAAGQRDAVTLRLLKGGTAKANDRVEKAVKAIQGLTK